MKLANIAYLLTLGIALSISSTGCRKGIDKTTPIPGRMAELPKETTPADLRTGTKTTTPIGPGTGIGPGETAVPSIPIQGDPSLRPNGIPTPPVDPLQNIPPTPNTEISTWDADPSVFKDQTVYFDFDKSVVKPSEVLKLQEVARRMKAEFAGPNKALRIEGHCDERGTEEYNRALGDRRASSIRAVLAAEGVDPAMIQTITMGEEKPAVPGHDDAAWSKNRRGEIFLLTKPGTN